MSRGNRPPPKDMYWFAHGGAENENSLSQRPPGQIDCEEEQHSSGSPVWNITERKGSPEDLRISHIVMDAGNNSSGPSSLERDDRLRAHDKRVAVEERRKQIWEAEQERNDALLRKHMEREAALEARRNAQRSTIAFAFGSSRPRNIEALQASGDGDIDIMSRSFTASGLSPKESHDTFHDRRSVSPLKYGGHTLLVDGSGCRPNSAQSLTSYSRAMPPPCWLTGSGALVGEDVMSRSMTGSLSSAPRGRRKNDLMPTVPYDRAAPQRAATTSSSRKRSVSMTRLDQLALPRRHYVEANKANSTVSSGDTSMQNNVKSPTRPLSSASENSGGSGRVASTVTRRVRSSPRKPRPVSIAGTLPDQSRVRNPPMLEVKVSPVKRSYTPSKRPADIAEVKKNMSTIKTSTPKSSEKLKSTPRPSTAAKPSTPKPSTSTTPKPTKTEKTASPKAKEKKPLVVKKKSDAVASAIPAEVKGNLDLTEKQPESSSQPLDADTSAENETNNAKRIISEEEAKTALAEKRRLAREQAEREAELERQRQEELRLEEEERMRKEEEDQRKMEEEQLRLLEEHRRQEEEKLRKAIEEQEQKEAEEKAKRDEDMRMKAEQEKKAKEEAEKQRIELEEKLRKEEEERAERKKRLDKIMSRTRGKSSGTSPSGSVSGSDQLDSGENPHENFSSGANSLDSNEAEPSEQASLDDHLTKAEEVSSAGDSMEGNPTYEIGSENESLNSNDLMMPTSETASQENSLIIPEKDDLNEDISSSASVSSRVAIIAPEDQAVEAAQLSDYEDTTLQESSHNVSDPMDEVPFIDDHTTFEEVQAVKVDAANDQTVRGSAEPQDIVQSGDQQESQPSQFGFESEPLHTRSTFSEVTSEAPSSSYSEENNDLAQSFSKFTENEETNQGLLNPQEINNFKANINQEVEAVLSNEIADCASSAPRNNNDVFPKEDSFFGDVVSEATIKKEEIDFAEADILGANRCSLSSDIKLPDPIYETSDDGSVSSEKLAQDFRMETQTDEFNFTGNQENVAVDDVFSVQPFRKTSEPLIQDLNPFAVNGFPDESDSYSSPNFNNFGVVDNMYESSECNALPDVMDQPVGIEENVLPSQSSTSQLEVQELLGDSEESKQHHNFFYGDGVGNKENIERDFNPNLEVFNQFSNENGVYDTYDPSDKENMFTDLPPYTVEAEVHHFEELKVDMGGGGDNPFTSGPFYSNSEFQVQQLEVGNNSFTQQHVFSEAELGDTFGKNSSSNSEALSDVTFIKSGDDGACIGIISSVDHDTVLNDFPKPTLPSEKLKNFESSSVTDSEDSSLDSNLSQVMTVENSENDTPGGLNHVKNSILESDSSKLVYSNGGHANPFESEHIYNNDSISKSGVNSFSASEVFSNGHRLESSKQVPEHGYGQFDGNDILPVDHSNNMFENVDAIDYSKVSPDPFLAKGNSIQISGNPFLVQDDQKQVLVTPDFLN